jgi:hypothetical protein
MRHQSNAVFPSMCRTNASSRISCACTRRFLVHMHYKKQAKCQNTSKTDTDKTQWVDTNTHARTHSRARAHTHTHTHTHKHYARTHWCTRAWIHLVWWCISACAGACTKVWRTSEELAPAHTHACASVRIHTDALVRSNLIWRASHEFEYCIATGLVAAACACTLASSKYRIIYVKSILLY